MDADFVWPTPDEIADARKRIEAAVAAIREEDARQQRLADARALERALNRQEAA